MKLALILAVSMIAAPALATETSKAAPPQITADTPITITLPAGVLAEIRAILVAKLTGEQNAPLLKVYDPAVNEGVAKLQGAKK